MRCQCVPCDRRVLCQWGGRQGAGVLYSLVGAGIVVWGAVMVCQLTRRFWPVGRRIPLLMRAELIFGGASLLLLAVGWPAHQAEDLVGGCLAAAIGCGLLAAGPEAWRRHRNGLPVLRRSRSRIPASHVYIWVDLLAAMMAAVAAPWTVSPPGSRPADMIGAVTGAGTAGLVASIRQSNRLRQHNRAESTVGPKTLP
jgi:hypothetical protein